jgi:phosphatidylglycerophosphate synthase
LLASLEKRIWLPDVNPAFYHASELALSIVYLYAAAPAVKITLLAAILLLDWVDGATARRFRGGSRSGYIIDTLTDRASEGFIFAAEAQSLPGQAFFLLWLLNCALTYYSIRTNRHISLALRFAYLVALVVHALWPGLW